ncbi:hypothetical protein LEMLEM_LOCUS8681, partial [Lemmus lemmus]
TALSLQRPTGSAELFHPILLTQDSIYKYTRYLRRPESLNSAVHSCCSGAL